MLKPIPIIVFATASVLFAGTGIESQDPREIVRRSVERDWTNFSTVKDYTYRENTDLRRYAQDGKVSESRNETHEILILGDRPYARLIGRNGQALSEAETRKEQEKLDREVAKREHESASSRTQYDKQRAEDRQFIREIPDAFTFRLVGVENVSNAPAWVIEAEPNPSYRAIHSDAKMFSKVRAKIWIEQATYHWVKLDAQILDTISFGLFLLRVAPGGEVHFEQTRVNDEIWLPSHILVHADARMALVKKIRAEYDIHYSDYQKFQSDSHLLTESGAGLANGAR